MPELQADVPPVMSVRWKATIGKSWGDLVSLRVGLGDEHAATKKTSEVSNAHLQKYLREISLEKLAQRSVQEDVELAPKFDEIVDEMTLANVAELRCTTHKLQTKKKRTRPTGKSTAARSGGFLVACTPSGFAVDAFEFLGAESRSQRYIFLARLKKKYPNFNVCVGDDNCHQRKFADNKVGLGPCVLDRFHAKGHVD